MTDRLVVILSTGEEAKARTGAMYAVNALKHGWMEDVKLIVFGPAQDLLIEGDELGALVREFISMGEPAVACRVFAERDANDDALRGLGLDVEYVGPLISKHIRDGYVPMVW